MASSIDRATAHIDNRFLRRDQRLQRPFYLSFMSRRRRIIRAHTHRVRPAIRQFLRRIQNILRQIHHHWPRTTACCQPEGFFQHLRDIFRLFDQEAMFHHRAGYTYHVALLEGIVANQRRCDLSGEDHQRNGIHVSRCDPGNRVGRPRP